MLNNNFSHTQLASAFLPRKDYYFVHDDTDAVFLFLLKLNFYISLRPFPPPLFSFFSSERFSYLSLCFE